MMKTITQSSRVAAPEKEPDAPTEIMTRYQVADYLMCHPHTVYRLLKKRQIPAFRLFSEWRFRRSDIEKWIRESEVRLEEAGKHERELRVRRRRHKSRR
jgi:excisionase family DNA binding protein